MEIVKTVQELRQHRRVQGHNKTVGVVPTMGDLHEGHYKLIDACRERCDLCVATLFVNPLQFGPSEDFSTYPRSLENDATKLRQRNVDLLFAPSVDEMYPDGQSEHTAVVVPQLGTELCGRSRPGHFDGVTTVVAKLFQLTQPDFAFFGEKDWQQLTIIKRMVRQLDFPLEVIGVPTFREVDGLAMSSRNRYLSQEEREHAPSLYLTLRGVAAHLHEGSTAYGELEQHAASKLEEAGFKPDYVAIRDPDTLQPPTSGEGAVRLIDNIGVVR